MTRPFFRPDPIQEVLDSRAHMDETAQTADTEANVTSMDEEAPDA